MIQFEFQQTLDDFYRLTKELVKQSKMLSVRLNTLRFLISLLLMFFSLKGFYGLANYDIYFNEFFIWLISLIVVISFLRYSKSLYLTFIVWQTKMMMKSELTDSWPRQFLLTINQDEIHLQLLTGKIRGTTLIRQEAIQSITQDSRNLYLLLNGGTGISLPISPPLLKVEETLQYNSFISDMKIRVIAQHLNKKI